MNTNEIRSIGISYCILDIGGKSKMPDRKKLKGNSHFYAFLIDRRSEKREYSWKGTCSTKNTDVKQRVRKT